MNEIDKTPTELAYRAGFREGYTQGENDYAKFEFGGGSTPQSILDVAEDTAWQDYLEEMKDVP